VTEALNIYLTYNEYYKEFGIIHETIAPYSLEMNGKEDIKKTEPLLN